MATEIIKPPPDWKVSPMSPKLPERQSAPVDQTRIQFLDGLRGVLDNLRNDPVGGPYVRRFETILNLIRSEESGSYMGADPLLAIRKELEKAGTWMRVQDLAIELNKRDVMAPSTRNSRDRQLKRRALTNVERIVRIALQAVNHNRLAGYKIEEQGLLVTYIGMTNWPMPKGVTPMEAKKNRQPKRKQR